MDDPRLTAARRRIIREKPFLRRIYEDWYRQIIASLPEGRGRVVELGSGAGFLRDRLAELITSEIFPTPEIDLVMDGAALPLDSGSLRAVVMVDVLHHIPQPRRLFAEAARCVRPGGRIVMIEPWVTPWSSVIYGRLHHEPFDPRTREWEFLSTGPLSGANGALPWILFQRDRTQFEREFPAWQIRQIELQMPFRYIVSGGVSMRSLSPGWTYVGWSALERLTQPWAASLAMFARIVLQRSNDPSGGLSTHDGI